MSEQRDGQRDYGDECGCGCQEDRRPRLADQMAVIVGKNRVAYREAVERFHAASSVQPEERGKGS